MYVSVFQKMRQSVALSLFSLSVKIICPFLSAYFAVKYRAVLMLQRLKENAPPLRGVGQCSLMIILCVYVRVCVGTCTRVRMLS